VLKVFLEKMVFPETMVLMVSPEQREMLELSVPREIKAFPEYLD